MRTIFITLCLALLTPVSARAIDFEAGKHYEVIASPVATTDAAKIEVTEVFWYGCIHCFRFEPMVQEWKKSLADDVIFVGVPAMWNRRLRLHAQAYYTARKLGVMASLHQPLFDALNTEDLKLANDVELAQFFAKHGIDREAFYRAFNSSEVTENLENAANKTQAYGVQGTPELIINGRYRVSAQTAGGQTEMLAVADFLIDKERQAMQPATPEITAQNRATSDPDADELAEQAMTGNQSKQHHSGEFAAYKKPQQTITITTQGLTADKR